MPADRDFQCLQYAFTAWLREPETRPAPAVGARRLRVYRELFFNNVSDFVESAYPVLRSLLPGSEWQALLQRFFAEHRAQSPYFRDISLEFRRWLEAARPALLEARPWVAELLHYEWAELAADCAETAADAACDPKGDLLDGVPLLRAAVWPLAYRWPVHRLGPDNPPSAEPPAELSCLLLFRDDADRVEQLEVSPLTARLVELLQANEGRSGRELLRRLADEAAAARPEEFVQQGAGLLERLREQGIVLGVRLG